MALSTLTSRVDEEDKLMFICELPIKLTLVIRLRHLHRPTHPSPDTVLHFQQT